MTLAASILASVAILAAQWLYGNKSLWGPIAGLVGQLPWAALIVLTGAHGLWLSWVPMTFIHARNLWRWRREGDGGRRRWPTGLSVDRAGGDTDRSCAVGMARDPDTGAVHVFFAKQYPAGQSPDQDEVEREATAAWKDWYKEKENAEP